MESLYPQDGRGLKNTVPKTSYRRRVEFAETDAAGIVHFSVFFRYMEEAEHAIWRLAGLNIVDSGRDVSWPRIAAKFDFKAPLKFQDDFEVRTEMGAVTRSTIQWAHVLMRGDTIECALLSACHRFDFSKSPPTSRAVVTPAARYRFRSY